MRFGALGLSLDIPGTGHMREDNLSSGIDEVQKDIRSFRDGAEKN